ncbi:MAG: GFA family protein [Sulfurifustis sp.]
MKKTYTGSCHCGKVRYEANLDLSQGTGRCNCSYCAKVRNWSVMTKPVDFRLLTDEKDLGDYQFTEESPNHHFFCKHCGVRMFTRGYVEAIGGDFISVTIATIDNLSDKERAELPVRFMNGRNNDWFSTPAETRHL